VGFLTMTAGSHERNLRVLLADEDKSALEHLAGVLDGLGHEVVPFAVSVQEAIDLIAREDPDLAIVVVHHDDQHGLALIGETVEFASGPVIVHLRAGEGLDVVARAADLGIAAYLDSSEPQDVQATIEVALRRYREQERLNQKIDQLETALARRATIERAKGILMERHQLDEREAFERLREHARAGSRRVVDIAQAVLDGHALLPGSR
jgi:response regulator NasT